MAKARVIDGLRATAGTRASLPAVLNTRIGEMWVWAEYLEDPNCVQELHAMRIAAKRVRYLFEIFLPCFGPGIADELVTFKRLQDYLGDIHDCDIWSEHLCGQLLEELVEAGFECPNLCLTIGAQPRLKQLVQEQAPKLAAGPARGIIEFIAHIVDRRSALYVELLAFWSELEDADFRAQLTATVAKAAGTSAGGVVQP